MAPDAEVIATCLRRGHDPEVRRKLVLMLAEETGWTPKVLAEKTGYSVSEIHRILPDHMKKKTRPTRERCARCVSPPPSLITQIPEPTQPRPRREPNLKLIAKTNYLITAESIRRDLERRKLSCPKCGGGTRLLWDCCGGDVADPALLEKLRTEIRI